ncbi:MAG: T9SS type A sorting domain-containing protein [Chitinophagaceae bacterium]
MNLWVIFLTGLTVGTTYYIRVFSASNPIPITTGGFSICVTDPPPANDNCSGAILLTETATCSPIFGTLLSSTNSGIAIGACSGTPDDDVWYKFVPTSTHPTIKLNNIGQNLWNLGGPRMQLFSGTCGVLVSVACGGPNTMSPNGLTIGATYYIRVYSLNSGPAPGGTAALAGFDICVTDPAPADVELSKSYINISKGSGGGTVNPGDTLEMRATIVVSSQTVDSVVFFDTLYRGKGLRLVPNSISLRTNEGKVYKSFTDIIDLDEGRAISFGAGPDTAIRMNIGLGASNVAKGKLRYTSKPSFYDKVCILMATYRVVVYAPYDTKVNFGAGTFSYVDTATVATVTATFKKDSIIVYKSVGLCPNAVAASNAIGIEFNGTFGAPVGGAPLERNRAASSYVPNYTFDLFDTFSGPDDYRYGVTNNTSARYSTVTTFSKPDGNSPKYRQFDKWDISGDHTGATNPLKGNPPCDTTLPVSATNPCGYMLVINSAYRTDTAFHYIVSNLCPNTYYELSAWIKNICYYCACDSNGNPANDPAYIPSGPNDSSGVQPNLAFEINGTDYYTTGNIKYMGTTNKGSDSSNQWVKKGFVYQTGPSETSFILDLRNNAPGGGGNDWAIDDISLATCMPEMKFLPNNPTVCRLNAVSLYDTVSSFYNTYVYYKWQRSINSGATWNDVTGPQGPISPTFNASLNKWQYLTHYVVSAFDADNSNNGNRYRVVTATTSGNLSSSNCIFTDGTSFATLTVLNCGTPLKTDILSFTGVLTSMNFGQLYWTTSKEDDQQTFYVERSIDGHDFTRIGTVPGYNNNLNPINQYSFTDPVTIIRKTFYRIAVVDNSGQLKYSRIIQLSNSQPGIELYNVINPFDHELIFDISSTSNTNIDISLLNMAGKKLIKKNQAISDGLNNIHIPGTEALPPGMYILQVKDKERILIKKIVKK